MARIEKITNRTDLLAFIYDPDVLPTAIVKLPNGGAFSVHGLREGEEGLLERVLKEGGVTVDDDGYFNEELNAYRFWDDYRELEHVCYGIYFAAKTDGERYKFKDILEWGTKTFEMCA